MTRQYRIFLADDHVLLRHGLKRILSERKNLDVVGEVGDGLDLIRQMRKQTADLVILDISMPHLRGIEAISEIRKVDSAMKVLILTMHGDEDHLNEAIAAGADGYLLKGDPERELFKAIDVIRAGRTYITPRLAEDSRQDWVRFRRGKNNLHQTELLSVREKEVMRLIAEGKSSKEIGGLLFISVRTVERHRSNIMQKLRLKNAAEMVRFAVGHGLAGGLALLVDCLSLLEG